MNCPYCSHADTKVLDSRDVEDINAVRRRRECLECGKRFTTYERIESVDLWVIKKDGSRERFDPAKIKRGIMRACEKRKVPMEAVDKMVSEIEGELMAKGEEEIKSKDIGELVMGKLREVDEVAYIRFASVYRSFTDISSFEKELHRLLRKKKPRK